ncbi:hypothetical protein LSAT2_005085 [Lamellibrachia satsuma]|nr:hypothetical protein LSAT2_005085 [Lamellibrachia satsuma]
MDSITVGIESLRNRQLDTSHEDLNVKTPYGNYVILQLYDTSKCSDGDDRSCYKLVEAELTHLEANVNCQNLGSNLVSIESEAENKFLVDMIKNLQNDCKQVHTSGRRSDSGWVWGSTGQAFTYTNWAPSEPNNWQGLNEDMVVGIDRIATEGYSHGVVTTSLSDTFRVLNPHQPDLRVNRAIATCKQNGRSIEEETGRPRFCDSSDILCMLSCPAPTDGGAAGGHHRHTH